MNSIDHEGFSADPPMALLKRLQVRALQPHEYDRAGQLLQREHYLGDVPQGRQWLQAVESGGQWVALLDWGPATWKLADREEWIGGTAQQRTERSPAREPGSARGFGNPRYGRFGNRRYKASSTSRYGHGECSIEPNLWPSNQANRPLIHARGPGLASPHRMDKRPVRLV
jgi:hypothetical protein